MAMTGRENTIGGMLLQSSIVIHLAINRKRNVMQCKAHWGGVKKDVVIFCGAYSRARRTWSSGYSDDMITKKAHAVYKLENNDKTFTLEYMWRELKDQPK
jgi:hypothetical protein